MTARLGPELTRDAELLWRQVHPNFLAPDGRVSSQAFQTMKKDEGLLSVDRSSLVTAEGAFVTHTQVRRLASSGVVAVTLGEVVEAGLRAHEDPQSEDHAHAVIDMRHLTGKPADRVAKKLVAKARERGWQYRPP